MTNNYPIRWLHRPLSNHQRELLRLYMAGWTTPALCKKFNIGRVTLASTLGDIQEKFNAPNRRTMIMLAHFEKLFTLEELLPPTIVALNTPDPDDQTETQTDEP